MSAGKMSLYKWRCSADFAEFWGFGGGEVLRVARETDEK